MGIIDIVKICPQKQCYSPTYDNNNFGSTNDYLLLAKRSISKFAPRFLMSDIVRRMLASDDVVSNIATDIMLAEWRCDDSIGNRECFRIQCAIFSILKYIRRIKSDKNGKNVSFNMDTETVLINEHNSVLLNENSPEYITIKKEEKNQLYSILANNLSDIESECIILYYINNLNCAEIGRMKHKTREGVRQIIKRAMKKLTNN
jgi:RNA polymerase sigma factor (sigma-70 family)